MTSIIEQIKSELENVREVGEGNTPLQNTPEWHEARLKRFTASRAGDIMKEGRGKDEKFGVPCLKYIHEKLAEILTQQPHIIESRATNWGHDIEAEAVDFYEGITDNKTSLVGFIEYNDYAGGSPDRLIGEEGILEIKCPYNPANHVSVMLSNEVPEPHYWQCQFNLMVTGRKWCDYASYDPRITEEPLKMVIIRIDRNEDHIDLIKDRLIEVKQKLDELKTQIEKP